MKRNRRTLKTTKTNTKRVPTIWTNETTAHAEPPKPTPNTNQREGQTKPLHEKLSDGKDLTDPLLLLTGRTPRPRVQIMGLWLDLPIWLGNPSVMEWVILAGWAILVGGLRLSRGIGLALWGGLE